MTTEPPLPLRQVALLLGNIQQLPRNQSDVSGLLRLLKAGELKAGFEFPGTRVFWIPISTRYWTGVSSDKFRALRYQSDDKLKKGTYKVLISDFVDEYIQVVSPVSIPAVLDELRKALSAARQSFEVVNHSRRVDEISGAASNLRLRAATKAILWSLGKVQLASLAANNCRVPYGPKKPRGAITRLHCNKSSRTS
jgi:hypothetical protein